MREIVKENSGNKSNPICVQELIKEWREFLEEWQSTRITKFGYVHPRFYDFMQWLSDKYKQND